MEHQQGLIGQMKKAMERSEEKLKDAELQNRSLLERLEAMKLDYELRLENAEKNNSLLTRQCDELITELEAAEKDRKKLQSKVEEMEPNQKGLQQSLQNSEDSKAEIIDLHQHEMSELEGKIEDLKRDLNTLSAQKVDEEHWKNEYKKWSDSLKKEIKEKEKFIEQLEGEVLTVRQEARLANKMFAKVQIDLSDLQQSYKQKSKSELELVGLVKELKYKLEAASSYYFKLQQQYPEILKINADNS